MVYDTFYGWYRRCLVLSILSGVGGGFFTFSWRTHCGSAHSAHSGQNSFTTSNTKSRETHIQSMIQGFLGQIQARRRSHRR